jgi:flagellar basal body rod protein FlgC
MDRITASVDVREFMAALQAYEKESSRDLKTVVKSTAIDVAFKANQSATAAKKSSIPNLKTGLFNALAAKAGFTRGNGNQREAERLYNRRISAIKYSKSLFLKMAQDLGAKVASLRKKIENAGAEDKGTILIPAIELTIEGVDMDHASKVLAPALQEGVNKSAAKMRQRIADKIAKRAQAHSGRRR